MDATGFRIGTDKQHAFAEGLSRKAGYASIIDACADALGLDPDDLVKDPLSAGDASRVISHLQVKAEAVSPAPEQPRRKNYLTARQLRRIATGQQRAPEELDEDASWVLDLLGKGLAIRALFSDELTGRAVNGDQPIAMEHLLSYYKTWDALAEAFRVTVPTAKAWGTHLPAGRAFEAEVRTRGYVRAPTQAPRTAA